MQQQQQQQKEYWLDRPLQKNASMVRQPRREISKKHAITMSKQIQRILDPLMEFIVIL